MSAAAVFVDRDGTVIEDRHYLSDPDGVALLPGAADAIAKLNEADIPVILVTNQSGIGRGYFSESEYRAVHDRMVELLASSGAILTASLHCPHAPNREPPCDCRKPKSGLFLMAAEHLGLSLADSWYVGDKMRDLEPGIAEGGRGYLIAPGGRPAELPTGVTVVDSLMTAVADILGPAD